MTDDEQTPIEGKRYTVLVEGVVTSDGRSIHKGAIKFRPEPVAVRIHNPRQKNEDDESDELDRELIPHGVITDLKRESDGRVTGMVSPPIPDGTCLGAEVQIRQFGNGHAEVADGVIMGATVLPQDKWPWPGVE